MEKHEYYLLVISVLFLATLAVRLFSSPSYAMGFSISSETYLIFGGLLLAVLFLLFYEDKKKKFEKPRFKRAYKPKSDLDRIRYYIRDQKEMGHSRRKIKSALLKVNWDSDLIRTAFNTLDKLDPIKPGKNVKKIKIKRNVGKKK